MAGKYLTRADLTEIGETLAASEIVKLSDAGSFLVGSEAETGVEAPITPRQIIMLKRSPPSESTD